MRQISDGAPKWSLADGGSTVVTRGCDGEDRVVGGQPAAVVADCQNQQRVVGAVFNGCPDYGHQ